jgi:rsbT co-antagonist protein RsbR
MNAASTNGLHTVLTRDTDALLTEWQGAMGTHVSKRIDERTQRNEATEFLKLLATATANGSAFVATDPNWQAVEGFLGDLSRSRALLGFGADETATFVFSLKRPLFTRLQQQLDSQQHALAGELWRTTELFDSLGLRTFSIFQKAREDVIQRQQLELLELSTPVIKLWDGILALPVIGTLDSTRTQIVMETLLQRIVETGSEIAIIDITGVPTVDTLVAQYLIKAVTAIRLMGADCIISGIRPQIAQTIVHLGVDLSFVTTKASLADALSLALKRTQYSVQRKAQ